VEERPRPSVKTFTVKIDIDGSRKIARKKSEEESLRNNHSTIHVPIYLNNTFISSTDLKLSYSGECNYKGQELNEKT
jgi:hypothetical protein